LLENHVIKAADLEWIQYLPRDHGECGAYNMAPSGVPGQSTLWGKEAKTS